jgi:O-antigen ligase
LPSELQETPPGSAPPAFREKLDRLCERGILGAVLAILIWGPLAYGAVRVNPGTEDIPRLYSFLVIQGLTALAVVLWGARFYTQRPFRLLWPPVCWAVLAFVAYAIVRCQFVEVDYAGRRQLAGVIVYAALFFVILNNLNRRESATTVAMVLIVLGLGESVWAFYQFVSHDPRVWEVLKPPAYAVRGSGTFINPNNFAGFAEMILPLALAYTVMGRLSAVMKVLVGYCALVMMAGVVVSQSRGGNAAMAATLVVFCVILLFQRDYWRRGVLALGLLAVAGVVLLQQFGQVMERLDNGGGLISSSDGRVFYWDAAKRIFHQHLLWGAGPGQFPYQYPKFALEWGQVSPQNAHNDYLNTLCEWGLAGFAIVIVTVGLLYGGVWRVWPYVKRRTNELGRRNSSKAAFVLGASLGLLSILIHSGVDFNMQIPANAILAVTLMALLSAHWRFGTEGYWANPGKTGKILLAAAALGVAGYLGAQGARAGREFYWIQRGLNEKVSWDQQVAALKKAQEIEPRNYLTQYELGEVYRLQAWEGNPGNEALAKEAMKWFEGAMMLNPLDSWSPIRYGMCLDWLDRPNEASQYFVRALELRPNNATIYFYLGWHCLEVGNYPLAEHWLWYSQILHPPSEQAAGYLQIVRERMAAEAKAAHGR